MVAHEIGKQCIRINSESEPTLRVKTCVRELALCKSSIALAEVWFNVDIDERTLSYVS